MTARDCNPYMMPALPAKKCGYVSMSCDGHALRTVPVVTSDSNWYIESS
jgi:hypothetical protein